MALLKYPYTNLHELNLDWLIEQLNKPDGPVRSVNGKSGIVTLTGEDLARSTSNPETVAAALQTQGSALQTVRNQIGVTALPTVAQTLTGAIAENAQTIADVQDNVIGSTALPTTAQTLTGAIAENANEISNVKDNVIGNTALPTTAQTLTGAIAENAGEIANIQDDIGTTTLPTTAQTITGAIAEHEADISNINTALTPDWTGMSSYLSSLESGANALLQTYGKERCVAFQGANRTHTEDEILFTLPAEHRPLGGNVYASGCVGSTPVVLRINYTNGECSLYVSNGVTAQGRIYFNASWVVA